jgi:hypothetical protein
VCSQRERLEPRQGVGGKYPTRGVLCPGCNEAKNRLVSALKADPQGCEAVPRVMAPVQTRHFLVVSRQATVERELDKLFIMTRISPKMDVLVVRDSKQPAQKLENVQLQQ